MDAFERARQSVLTCQFRISHIPHKCTHPVAHSLGGDVGVCALDRGGIVVETIDRLSAGQNIGKITHLLQTMPTDP